MMSRQEILEFLLSLYWLDDLKRMSDFVAARPDECLDALLEVLVQPPEWDLRDRREEIEILLGLCADFNWQHFIERARPLLNQAQARHFILGGFGKTQSPAALSALKPFTTVAAQLTDEDISSLCDSISMLSRSAEARNMVEEMQLALPVSREEAKKEVQSFLDDWENVITT